MRLNAKEPLAQDVKAVYLDNVKIENCVEADDEEGYVIVLERRNAAGAIIQEPPDFINPFEPWIERRKTGQVRIEF